MKKLITGVALLYAMTVPYVVLWALFQGTAGLDCTPLGRWGYVFPYYQPTCKGFRWMADK